MKLSLRSFIVPVASALLLAFSLSVRADETSREEIKHAFHLLKWANADYHGHKAAAMDELKAAGREVGYDLEGEQDRWHAEHQWKSDDQLREARRLLRHARDHYENADREHLAHHIEKAIKELDAALDVR